MQELWGPYVSVGARDVAYAPSLGLEAEDLYGGVEVSSVGGVASNYVDFTIFVDCLGGVLVIAGACPGTAVVEGVGGPEHVGTVHGGHGFVGVQLGVVDVEIWGVLHADLSSDYGDFVATYIDQGGGSLCNEAVGT